MTNEASPNPSTPSEPRRVALAQMKVGQTGVIHEKQLEQSDRELLRAMGLACNATVRLCRAGEPCIVAVMSGGRAGGRLGDSCCRIGLARPLAEKIFVCVEEAQTGRS